MTTTQEQRARLDELLARDGAPSQVSHKTIAVDALVQAEGVFTALVASFDTLDRAKDIIRRGAFSRSLDRWRKSRKRIPIIWSHQADDPTLVIGSADPAQAYETDEGLVLQGRLNIDNNAAANHVYDLLKQGDVDSWSFGYKVIRGRRRSDGVTELLELDLFEAGPTATPANAAARTLSVKGVDVPQPESEEPPSHVQLEARLAEEGIIAPIVDPEILERERDLMRAVLTSRANGQHERDGKSADAEQRERFTELTGKGDWKAKSMKAPGQSSKPIKVAEFDA